MNRAMFALVLLAVLFVASTALAGAGEDAFNAKCAVCHGRDGLGATTMGGKLGVKSLLSPEILAKTDAQLEQTILNGIPEKKMMPYKDKLELDVIKQVVLYIRTLKK